MRYGILARALLLATMLGCALPAHAGQQIGLTFGWVEMATLQSLDAQVKTKLDTGALTSSLHATNIERFEKDDEDWVRFTVRVQDEASGEMVSKQLEKPLLREVTLRGAGGEDHRPVVVMPICVAGVVHEEQFSLRNRENMIYPVLLGRRAIQHLGVVDVTRTFLTDPHCDEDAPVVPFDPDGSDEDIGI